MRESNGPVVVTRNGYDEFVALTPDLFHEYETIRRRQELYAEVDAAEARLEASQGIPARDMIAQIRQRYGL